MPSDNRIQNTEPPHYCQLDVESTSFLPKLPPNAHRYYHIVREFRKVFLISSFNSATKQYFRSQASVAMERKRHIKSRYWYIIHPLSTFCMFREYYLMAYWLVFFIVHPMDWVTRADVNYEGFLVIFEKLYIVEIIAHFFIGYINHKTKEVIIAPKLIAKHYLKTFLVIDILTIFPSFICWKVCSFDHPICGLVDCVQTVIRLFRLDTFFIYLRRITDNYNFTMVETSFDVLRLFFLTVIYVHNWTCIIYRVPVLSKQLGYTDPYWIDDAGINEHTGFFRIYCESMLQTICLFYRAGIGMYGARRNVYQILLFSSVILTGIVFFSFMIVTLSRVTYITKSAENRYDCVMAQLEVYMAEKNMSLAIRRRLLSHFKYRFHRKYYNENMILHSLSEHLRYEIMLFTCRPLVENVEVFKLFPKPLIGKIIAIMKQQIYLPEDVIIKTGTESDSFFFVLSGTLAVYASDGTEICHMEDACSFGYISAVLDKKRFVSVVAIEVCELYKIDKDEFMLCMKMFPDNMKTLRMNCNLQYDKYKKNMKMIAKGTKTSLSMKEIVELL